jgi:hypothetical protein
MSRESNVIPKNERLQWNLKRQFAILLIHCDSRKLWRKFPLSPIVQVEGRCRRLARAIRPALPPPRTPPEVLLDAVMDPTMLLKPLQ